MKIAGADTAIKGISFYLFESNQLVWIQRPKSKNFDDTLKLYFEECSKIDAEVVWIEEVAYVRNYKATLQMSQILGIVKLAFILRNIPVYTVTAPQWKKDVLGNGKATKEQIIQFVQTSQRFNFDKSTINDDAADSCCIALFGKLRMEK